MIIINTCAFIKDAKEESVEAILEAAEYKNSGKCRLLVVAGCLPQRYAAELARELPEVDILIGTNNGPQIAALLERHQKSNERIKTVSEPVFLYDHSTPRVKSSPHYSAYVKITEGCVNHCSYCVIPKLRGPLRSRSIDSVVAEVENLTRDGVKEINLIGQDTTAFGRENGKPGIETLLRELVKINDLHWLRLLYTHPAGISDELIEMVAAEEKICKYFDVPLQHVEDRILEQMNRRINQRQIRTLLTKIRRRIPDVVLRTSFIVGFPGETDEQFAELLNFTREGFFERVGVFRYSREEGTPAANMENQIPPRVQKNRQEKLMKAQKRVSFKKNRSLVGRIEPAIVEGYSEETELLLKGRSIGQAPDIDGQVYITSGQAEIGQIVALKITDSSDYDLIGEIVEV
jgi:ribosomal protein S12 methylthiotransferase